MTARGPVSVTTVVDGGRVHARVLGRPDARPIVLLPGLGMSHRTLEPLGRALAADHHVFILDPPGSGHSSRLSGRRGVGRLAEVLVRWVRANGLVDPVLVGVSLGCQVVVEALRRAPDLGSGLVLVSPPFGPRAPTAGRQALGLARSAPWERPALIAMIAIDWLRTGPLHVLRLARAAARYPLAEAVGEVAAPVLILRGSHDPVAPADWVDELAAASGGRVRIAPGAGHGVHDATPRRVAEAIRTDLRARSRQRVGRPATRGAGSAS